MSDAAPTPEETARLCTGVLDEIDAWWWGGGAPSNWS